MGEKVLAARYGGYTIPEIGKIIIGPLLFAMVSGISAAGVPESALEGLGLLLWMVSWWILRPVPPGITALLPISAAAIFQLAPMEDVLFRYASSMVMLLLGANILTLSWHFWGLDRRLALFVLLKVGSNVKKQIIVWFMLAAVLSSVIPNAIVAAALIPIAVATLGALGIKNAEDFRESEYATGVLLALAWGSSIGFVTPLGGGMNLVVIHFVEEMLLHREFMYMDWIVNIFPLFFAVSIPLLIFLLKFPYEFEEVPGERHLLEEEYRKLGSMKAGEKWGAFLFVAAMLLSFARPLYAEIFPNLQPAYVFITAALLTFVIKVDDKHHLMNWDATQPKLMWGMYYLFAGGTAMGVILQQSGATDIIVSAIMPFAEQGVWGIVIVFPLLAGLLSNVMTITGSMSIVIPLLISTLTELGIDPLPFVYITAAAGNVAIMLPSSSGGPAIVAGYGVDLGKMARRGAPAAVVAITAAIIMGKLML